MDRGEHPAESLAMALFSTADVRRTARRTPVRGLDETLVANRPAEPTQPAEPAFGLIARPRTAVDDLIEHSAPAVDLRVALVPCPAPIVTPEVLPPTAHPGLVRRLLAESSTLLVSGVLAIEWASGMFH